MGMNVLDNCPRCGKVFVRGVRNVCPDCYAQVEEEFKRVYDYVRKSENRKRNIYEVSDATDVSVNQIMEFVRSGRISISEFPQLAYPCESCGEVLIVEGRLCENCRKKLSSEVRRAFEMEEEEDRRKKRGGYFILHDEMQPEEKKPKKRN